MLVVTVAASALGPLGVARRGVWDRTLRFDWPALTLGAVGLFALRRAGRIVRLTAGPAPTAAVPSPAPFGASSPSLATGLGLAWHSVRRGATLPLVSAVAASAIAVAAIVTAAGGSASLRLVTDEPHRFGAPWDAVVQAARGTPNRRRWPRSTGVDHAALIGGTDVAIRSDPMVWVQALFPIEGVPVSDPVIVEGRAPASDDEIALGTLTIERADVRIGDRVPLQALGDARA